MAAAVSDGEHRECVRLGRPPTRHWFSVVVIVLFMGAMAARAPSYAQESAPEPPAPPPFADFRLPVGAPARITIRYPAENAAARQRAGDLARGLSEQGLEVTGPVASPGRIASSTVSYFYAEDRPGAEIAARVLGPEWRPVQKRLPTREPLPRPGALELAIAGP